MISCSTEYLHTTGTLELIYGRPSDLCYLNHLKNIAIVAD